MVEVANVCEECYSFITTEVSYQVSTAGAPELKIRPEPFNSTLKQISLAKELGTVTDIAPVNHSVQSTWLLLAEDGKIFRFDAETGEFAAVAQSNVPSDSKDAFAGYSLRQRLHASNDGVFVAVVNDYGRYGQIIDLRSGEVTLSLDGGDYYSGTVPFSFGFAVLDSRVVAIHRTAWNRLDLSDPSSGELLSIRNPTSYRSEEPRPEHYLDYFHGALHISPDSKRILDDGWIWQPVGVPATWSLERWLFDNVWESEDGPTKRYLRARDYYWDHGVTWLDANTIAVEEIGDDDAYMIAGARVFDVTASEERGVNWRSDWRWAREVIAFPGPAGKFFSDGFSLFSSGPGGLSRWNIADGARTAQLLGFQPTHHHTGAGELAELKENILVRWSFESD